MLGLFVELFDELLFEPLAPFDPPVFVFGVVAAGDPLFCALGVVFEVPLGFVAEFEPFMGPVVLLVPPAFVFGVVAAGVPLFCAFGMLVSCVPEFVEELPLPLLLYRWPQVPPPMSAGNTRLGGAVFCAACPAARAASYVEGVLFVALEPCARTALVEKANVAAHAPRAIPCRIFIG